MALNEQKLAETLIQLNLLTAEQWNDVAAESKQYNIPPEDLLVQKKILTNEVLAKARAISLQIPYVDLSRFEIPRSVSMLIPPAVSRRYTMIPFQVDGEVMKVAMTDPTDFQAMEYLRARSKGKVEIYVSNPDDISSIIKGFDTSDFMERVDVNNLMQAVSSFQTEKTEENVYEIADISVGSTPPSLRPDGGPVVQLVDRMFEYALRSNASDIHIEAVTKEETRLRMRIDGILHEVARFPLAVHTALVSRIKIMSGLKIDEKRVPQDGRITLRSGNMEFDFRVSILPTVFGEKVVIRVLAKEDAGLTLQSLGFKGRSFDLAELYFKKTVGMFLTTGPTGSGKSTTLYTALRTISTVERNALTIEDPVESTLEGLNQVQINKAAGMDFGAALRSAMRQDPDIIMVGEIRDKETATLAIEAALTGHYVLSTLHTNSAAATISRLLDIGVEPFLIISCLNLCCAQRLARRLCPHCAESYPASNEDIMTLQKYLPFFFDGKTDNSKVMKDYGIPPFTDNQVLLKRPVGCNNCHNSGYRGRIGIYEVLEVTETIRQLTLQRASDKELEKSAVQDGMLLLIQEGLLKVLAGDTDIMEIMRVAF